MWSIIWCSYKNAVYENVALELEKMRYLQQLIFLCLACSSDCIKVVKYKSKLNGSLSISNFSLDNMEDFSLCLRVFSHSFSDPRERSIQSLVRVGDKHLLGILTQQHCRACNKSETDLTFLRLLIFFFSS